MKIRSLSARQAAKCEASTHPRCKCRCGGVLHGAARVKSGDELAWLDEDDPHYVKASGHPEQLRLELEVVA